jgi:cytochrome c peroxidase
VRRIAAIAAVSALVASTAVAAIVVGAPEEVEVPTVTVATDVEPAPVETLDSRDAPARADVDGAPASDPHAGRLSPTELDRLTAAVAQVDGSALEADLVAEGRILFRSAEVARDGESCQSCHTDGGANAELGVMMHPTSDGDFTGPRDTQPLWGLRDTAPYRWDGGIATLVEMVGGTIDTHFKPEQRVDVPRKTAALVAYLETIDPPATAYDRGRLSPAALRGQAIFDGKAGCASCHGGPLFTDNRLHVTGVPLAPGANDPGSSRIANAFSTPTLRDIANTAPYMHNGTIATLEDVIAFYESQSAIPGIDLTPAEASDLIEYLESL